MARTRQEPTPEQREYKRIAYNARKKRWREANVARVAAYKREYRIKNNDRLNAQKRSRYKDGGYEREKSYRAKAMKRAAAYDSEKRRNTYERNKDKARAANQARYRRMRDAGIWVNVRYYRMVKCDLCDAEVARSTQHINRSKKQGLNTYCSHKCAGLAKRGRKQNLVHRRSPECRTCNECGRNFMRHLCDIESADRPIGRMFCSVRCRARADRVPKSEQRKRQYRKTYGEYAEAAIALHGLARDIKNTKQGEDARKETP